MEFDQAAMDDPDKPGRPSVCSCPECSGVLWEVREGDLVRYRCRVGHSYTLETLAGAKAKALESALWAAWRALQESSSLARRCAERAAQGRSSITAERFEQRAESSQEHAPPDSGNSPLQPGPGAGTRFDEDRLIPAL